jgi:glucan phosphoethanolaminetransferase (alkaline phosphatase superfamily)
MLKIYISVLCCLPIFFDGYYFTGGTSSVLVFCLFSFILFSLFVFLGRYYLFAAVPFLVFSGLVTTYELLTHSKLSVNVIASVLETDFHETTEFIGSRFFIKYVLVMLAILISPYVLHRLILMMRLAPGRDFRINPALPLVCFVFLAGFHYVDSSGSERRSVNAAGIYNYYPMREVNNFFARNLMQTSLVVNKYRDMDFLLDSKRNPENDTSVLLVIGEAARTSSMGLYGSKYDTTPFLNRLAEKSPVKVDYMTDMVSASAYTRVSVPSLVSMSSTAGFDEIAQYPSLYRLVNVTGTDTVYLANKEQNTFFDSVINTMMQDNRNAVYSNNDTDYDGYSLGALFDIINDKTEKGKLITFQLSGSHYQYDLRYPPEHDCFTPATQEAYYLSSIRYTDHVLAEISKMIDQVEEPYVVIYTSDHGEYVNDDGDGIFGHGFRQFTRNEIEVPLVFIYNDAFVRKNPNVVNTVSQHQQHRVSHDNISHTVLGMLGISDGSYYDASYDIASPGFSEHKRFIVDCSMNIQDLEDYSFKQLLSAGPARPEMTLKAQCPG